MSAHEAPAMERITFPDRVANLGFRLLLPTGWQNHTLPDEMPDFDDPTALVPLAVVTAPYAAIAWSVAARPAYGDGTVSDWARYLLEHEGIAPRALGDGRLGDLPALVGEAGRDSEVGPLTIRFAFAEDGSRLINLSLTAPAPLADALVGPWFAALESFELASPQGPTVPLWPVSRP